MKRIADFLTDHRYVTAAIMLVLTVICAVLAFRVPANRDRTKYLADDSQMKQGLSIMQTAFPEAEEKSTVRVMFDDLTAERIMEVMERLEAIPNVSSVIYDAGSDDHNKANHSLFLVNSRYDYTSQEEKAIESAIRNGFPEYTVAYQNNDIPSTQVPLWIILFGVAVAVVILLIMAHSWLEPVLFLITIGCAVLINFGTNIVFPYIDEMTLTVGPILQFVLSMDYSIILMNRYRQEKSAGISRIDAMKAALKGSVSSIFSSSLTTAAGLLVLVFLSFKLGPELGIVLAKGVVSSMLCVFTILPMLILASDQWLEKTKKNSLRIPMGLLSRFSYKARYLMPLVFVILLIGSFCLQNYTQVTYTESSEDPLADVFPKENIVVVIYKNEDEEQIPGILAELEQDSHMTEILGYSNTLGKEMNAAEMSEAIHELGKEQGLDTDLISENEISILYLLYGSSEGIMFDVKMTIPQLFTFVCEEIAEDARYAYFFDEKTKEMLLDSKVELDAAIAQMKGDTWSRLVITSDYAYESPETTAYIDRLEQLCQENLGECYLVGNSVMVNEMAASFDREYLLITLITAAAIFLIVLLAFRRPLLPLLLTLIVQCGVFITVTVIGVYTGTIYYLALLVVQSILMGATIDYGIVFCNFYRESRKTSDAATSLRLAYEGSIHTIMTSGSILLLVLGSLGFFASSPMISEVCTTLAIGVFIAIVLILFVLPGLVAFCDRFLRRKDKQNSADIS